MTRRIVEAEQWMDRAACKGLGHHVFFPPQGGDHLPAMAVCAGCPVRTECLAYATEHGVHHGVWGGRSERQRRRARQHRGAA